LAGNAPAEVICVDATGRGWKNAHTSLQAALKNANGQHVPTENEALQNAEKWPPKQIRGRNRKSTSEPQVDTKGGGLRNDGIVMDIEDCLFEYNNAIYGGAIYNTNEANVTMTNCKFVRNAANEGGAMYNFNLSSPTITKSEFATNQATVHGGAMCNDYGASPHITACVFQQNVSDGDGGAMFTDDTASQFGKTAPMIQDCQFVDNEAAQNGGAIANYNKCSPAIEYCAFDGNIAKSGSAISNVLGVTAQITQYDFGKRDSVVNRP